MGKPRDVIEKVEDGEDELGFVWLVIGIRYDYGQRATSKTDFAVFHEKEKALTFMNDCAVDETKLYLFKTKIQ
jgi:hypothetical protein